MQVRLSGLDFSYTRNGFRFQCEELDIASGERVAVVGPSGCGKSTLLGLISGNLTPGEGRVSVGETILSQTTEASRRSFRMHHLGQIFQDFRLVEYLPVRENVRLPYRLNRDLHWDAATEQRLHDLADRCGILSKLQAPVHQLSSGEQQRTAFCRALIHRPQLILADEPTGHLDVDNRDRLIQLLLKETRASGVTVVLATHDPAVLPCFDRVIDLSTPRKNPIIG